MSRDREDGLSVGQQKEVILKLEQAGMSPREAQAMVASKDNELAKKIVTLVNEYANDKRAEYERLFDSQLENLVKAGYPASFVGILKAQKEDVVSTALEIFSEEVGFPFLPVMPREFRSAFDQFYEMGFTSLINLAEAEYVQDVPKTPYYIFGVRNGDETLGMSVEEAQFFLLTENQPAQEGLTEVEIAALIRHGAVHISNNGGVEKLFAPNSSYVINVSGSRYEYAVDIELNAKKVRGHSRKCEHDISRTPSLTTRLVPKLTHETLEHFLAQGRHYR